MSRPIPHLQISLLGIITIAVYGSWYYTFGAVLDPIIADTGWSESGLTTVFAAGGLLAGVGALAGGRLLDRAGSRVVFSVAAVVGLGSFQLAAGATTIAGFGAAAVVGSGAFGALGFYHITQTVAVRISPHATHAAIAIVTMWGAFASTVYLPIAAWLVTNHGWRATIRATTASAAIVLMLGAIVVNAPPGRAKGSRPTGGLRRALRAPAAVRFLAAVALAGVAISVVLVYQIPAMTAAGLSLATAAAIAAFRGVMQLLGRLPVTMLSRRVGTARSLRWALVVLAVGTAILPVAGTLLPALLFAVAAGYGIGAFSPLQGMQAAEEFESPVLGAALGVAAFSFALGGAVGPAVAGVLADATGSRRWPIVMAVVAAILAASAVRPATPVPGRPTSRDLRGGRDGYGGRSRRRRSARSSRRWGS